MGTRATTLSLLALCAGCEHDALDANQPDDMGVAPVATTPICSSEGFCWENPLPQGNPLWAAFAVGPKDVWAAGQGGTLLHYDGRQWGGLPRLTDKALTSIWGSGPGDVWITGEKGALIHWDGRQLALVDSGVNGELRGLWGSGRNDVWAAGETIAHYDGVRWTAMAGEETDIWENGVFGTAPDDVWFVGDVKLHEGARPVDGAGGLRWDGGRLRLVYQQVGAWHSYGPAWGSGRDDVWVGETPASDRPPLVWRYQGGHWKPQSLPTDNVKLILESMWGSGPNDIWLPATDLQDEIVFHFDGRTWAQSDIPHPSGSIVFAGTGPRSQWSLGGDSQIFHSDGSSWTRQTRDQIDPEGSGVASWITGSRSNDVWAGNVSWNRVGHFDGSSWSEMALPDFAVNVVYSPSPGELWATTTKGLRHYSQGSWAEVNGVDASTVLAACGSGPRDFWMVGSGGMAVHFDGKQFDFIDSKTREPLVAIACRASDSVDAISGLGTVVHWDGRQFQALPAPAHSVLSIAAAGRRRWIADDTGLFEGIDNDWIKVDIAGAHSFRRVVALSESDVWAQTPDAALFHKEASSWRRVDTGCALCSGGLWGIGTDLWLAGGNGSIVHQDR